MKAILMSIQPKWCELIASGKKTVEVRKTKPKLDVPFKVYIYMTAGDAVYPVTINGAPYTCSNVGGKCVIGEFVCDKIYTIRYRCGGYRCEGLTTYENDRVGTASQLSLYDMRNYLGFNDGYGWHISDLVIYDKPMELGEYCKPCDRDPQCDCRYCKTHGRSPKYFIRRPPQSWCYVEEVQG